jgi:hypothetical protein
MKNKPIVSLIRGESGLTSVCSYQNPLQTGQDFPQLLEYLRLRNTYDFHESTIKRKILFSSIAHIADVQTTRVQSPLGDRFEYSHGVWNMEFSITIEVIRASSTL